MIIALYLFDSYHSFIGSGTYCAMTGSFSLLHEERTLVTFVPVCDALKGHIKIQLHVLRDPNGEAFFVESSRFHAFRGIADFTRFHAFR